MKNILAKQETVYKGLLHVGGIVLRCIPFIIIRIVLFTLIVIW